MGKIRGLPGTPVQEKAQKDTEPSEEKQMEKAIDESFANSHANLMNEGEDDDWKTGWKRSEIKDNRGNDGDGDES